MSLAIAQKLVVRRKKSTEIQEDVVVVKRDHTMKSTPPVSQLPKGFGASSPEIYSPTATPLRNENALKIPRSHCIIPVAHISPTRRLDQILDASTAAPVQSVFTVSSASPVVARPSKTSDPTSSRTPPGLSWRANGICRREELV